MADILNKEAFFLPEGVIYLDGNSLGPLPRAVPARVQAMMADEWGEMLIRGWNKADWMAQPSRVGNMVARIIGAPDGSVVMGDTLSIKVFQALSSGLKLRKDRRVILSDNGNFPSDLYMAEGLVKLLEQGYELRTVAPEEVMEAISEDVAVVMLTEVDYRTGRKHDMKTVTELAQAKGAVMVWDLAHSAGALPVDMTVSNAEFGHRQPFEFDLNYAPGNGIERMRVGTPPVIQLTALEVAMELWADVDMNDLRAASIALQEQFIAEIERDVPALTLAVIDRGVIGDFRAPDIMRFGFTPLYIDSADVSAAVRVIADVMNNNLWDTDAYKVKSRVT